MTAIARAGAGVSQITYNGITFGDIDDTDKKTFHTFPPIYRISARNVYADDNRTIQHVAYTLTVVSGMFDLDTGGTIETRDGMEFLKKQLSQSGKQLLILGLGFGQKTIDDNREGKRNTDVMWGVKPQSVSYQPIGGTRFWQIDWVCQFNISECAQSNLDRDWLSFVYDTGYSNDFEGYTTRVITGKVVVAGLKKGVVTQTNVDRVKDQITIAIPLDYKRTTNEWRIGREKNIIEFSIVDEQLDADAPPTGLTEYDFDVEVSNDGIGFGTFLLSMSATGKVERGQNRALVANWFFLHILTEAAKFREIAKKQRGQGIVMPTGVTIGHRKGSRETRCSAQFTMVTCLRDLMARGSIWEPLAGTNYQRWAASMGKLWGNRGNANVRINPNDDVILDICEEPGSPGAGGPSFNSRTIGRDLVDPIREFSAGEMPSLCPDITKENSFLAYDYRLSVTQSVPIWKAVLANAMKIFEASPGPLQRRRLAGATSDDVVLGEQPVLDSAAGDQTSLFPNEFQQGGIPQQFVVWEGKMLRLKFIPVVPRLTQIGGENLIQKEEKQDFRQVADFLGCPLFSLRWIIIYLIPGDAYIRSFKNLPKNPLVCSTPDPGGNLDGGGENERQKRLQTPQQQARTNKLFTGGAISGDPFSPTGGGGGF